MEFPKGIIHAQDDLGRVHLAAAPAGEAVRKPRRFDMLAYSGGVLRMAQGGYQVLVVVDLAGAQPHRIPLPILLQHEQLRPVARADRVLNDGRSLRMLGEMMEATPDAQHVIALDDAGFPWAASIGFSNESPDGRLEYVAPGTKLQINGRTLEYPDREILVMRKSLVIESSFVAIGADFESKSKTMAASFTGAAASGAPVSAVAMWNAALEQAQARGLTKAQAISELSHRDPKLHRAYLLEYNRRL